MEKLLFHVILIDGTEYLVEADDIERNEGIYSFLMDGKVIAEFNGNRIAGYFVDDEEEEEDE